MTAPLLPEDGATFHARIHCAGSEFRASCFAQIDHKSSLEQEFVEHHMSASSEGARAWVHGVAAARAFTRIIWGLDE